MTRTNVQQPPGHCGAAQRAAGNREPDLATAGGYLLNTNGHRRPTRHIIVPSKLSPGCDDRGENNDIRARIVSLPCEPWEQETTVQWETRGSEKRNPKVQKC